MSLGLDIIEAVKRGGMNKWKPLSITEVNDNFKSNREEAIDFVYQVMGNKRWTVDSLHCEVNSRRTTKLAVETVRDYMTVLWKRGKIVRHDKKLPHIYVKE